MLTACLAALRTHVCCRINHNQEGSFRISAQPFTGVVGGADRDRTDDPLLAKQMLSQLSYSPGPPFGGIENGGIEN